MTEIVIIRNEDVGKVLIGVPKGHKHLRVCMKLKTGTILVFKQAAIANISRACITLKTHPSVQAQELRMETLTEEQRKKDTRFINSSKHQERATKSRQSWGEYWKRVESLPKLSCNLFYPI